MWYTTCHTAERPTSSLLCLFDVGGCQRRVLVCLNHFRNAPWHELLLFIIKAAAHTHYNFSWESDVNVEWRHRRHRPKYIVCKRMAASFLLVSQKSTRSGTFRTEAKIDRNWCLRVGEKEERNEKNARSVGERRVCGGGGIISKAMDSTFPIALARLPPPPFASQKPKESRMIRAARRKRKKTNCELFPT